MRKFLPALALAALFASGCYMSVPAPPPPTPTTVTTWGPLGGMSINTGVCAGQVSLNAGIASISDSCFTASTNVVLCTDTTAPNPVRCAAVPGTLNLSGTGNDTIAYARVK
jgi:hypothetical protein